MIASLSYIAAYDCNVTLGGGVVFAESTSMCDYVNYHVNMILVFGTLAVMFMLAAVILVAWYGRNMSVEQENSVHRYAWWALGSLILMPGFEFAFVLFYLCVVCLVFASIARCFISRIPPLRNSNAVTTVVTPDVVVVVVADAGAGSEPCCICLESGGGSDLWFTAPCNHSFHLQCIQKWTRESQGTCPLCRKSVWVS